MAIVERQARIQFDNILFATDFSKSAGAAAPYAAELDKHYKAKIYALHVRSRIAASAETVKSLREATILIAKARELINAFPGLQPQVLINDGDLWSNFQTTIERHKIDLVVMGTRGRSGISKLLLGSVAEEVFRHASCPVLTVGPHSPAEPRNTGEFNRILFATDFSPEADAAAPYSVSLAQEYQARLTMLHVISEPKVGDLVSSPELISSCSNLLRNLVPPAALLWCNPEYVVETGTTADKILEVAATRKADLIVLGIRHPRGIPGAAEHLPIATAHKIVSHAECPVLTIRG